MKLKDLTAETSDYEKKVALETKKPKSWLKTVSAFANCGGGKIIFGIDDEDNLIGIDKVKENVDTISELIKTKIDPIPEIKLEIKKEDNKDFVIFTVMHGEQTPYYYLESCSYIAFIRLRNQSVQANSTVLKRLVLQGIKRSYDSTKTDYKFNDFSFIKLKRIYRQRCGKDLQSSDFISFGLLDDANFLTLAGALVADESPIYQSRIFATHWEGKTNTQGLTVALDNSEFSGSLFQLLDDALHFIQLNTRHPWKKGQSFRVNLPEYPERAVQEALINALIHRDYTEYGSEIHIDIYADRMEIYSPGGMVDGTKIQNLDLNLIASKRRNPLIADLFARLSLMERRGTEFKKIKESYQNAINFSKDRMPKFYSDQDSFIVTLYNLNYNKSNAELNQLVWQKDLEYFRWLETAENLGFDNDQISR
ncbi:MAG: putative DNA binding domain-containing protein [Desulfovibrionaceae bacterium]|nr:putative DNA binding domain-containing protein [Desulfovibrionaceae bacterium]